MTKQLHYFIPGTMCDYRLWNKVLDFAPHINPIHCNYCDATTIDQMVESILAQAPEKSHLVGFSLGGYLGCLAALREPHKFISVTAIAASPAGLSEKEKNLRRNNADILKSQTFVNSSKKRLQQLLHPDHIKNQEIMSTILEMEKSLGKHVLVQQLLATINRHDISKELLQFITPLQFVMANDDQLVPTGTVERLSELSSHIALHKISNSGHMIPLEAPEKLASLLP